MEVVLSNDKITLTFSVKYLTLGKITVDNSVRYIPKSEQTRENKSNTIKSKSTPRRQNKKISQNNTKFLQNISTQGFKYLI